MALGKDMIWDLNEGIYDVMSRWLKGGFHFPDFPFFFVHLLDFYEYMS